MQKILTLIVTCGIIYLIIQNNAVSLKVPNLNPSPPSREEKSDKNKQPEFQGNFIERALSGVVNNVLSTENGKNFAKNLLRPMNNGLSADSDAPVIDGQYLLNSMFKITDFGPGEKGPASCGHTVTIHYKISDMKDAILEDKISTFQLGSGKIAPGLDAVIVGMKTNQTRQATINSQYMPETMHDKANEFKVTVLLKEISPSSFIDYDDIKIFDNRLDYKIPLFCANKVAYDAKITKLSNGDVLYNSKDHKKIIMTIGDSNYPMIFSHAIHSKIPVGNRTVIAKGEFFKSYESDFSAVFPQRKLPKNEYFMIEFSNFKPAITSKITRLPNQTPPDQKKGVKTKK